MVHPKHTGGIYMKHQTIFSILCAFFVLALIPCVMAQEDITIEPVWEFYNNSYGEVSNPHFPFMIALDGLGLGGPNPGMENTYFDMDLVSTLVRYDDGRLLLFVVENGIDESDPSHDAEMAAQYPDRTLWWLDDETGEPLGIALQPLTLGGGGVTFTRDEQEYTTLDFWPTSDFFVSQALDDRASSFRPDLIQEVAPKVEVDAEGNIYLTDRHMLVRYTPDGQGGFNAPTLAFEYPKVDPPVMPDGTVVTAGHYRSWSMKDVNIIGEGQNKIMTTAGRHWLDGAGIMYYTSDDGGETWTMRSYKGQEQRGSIVGTGGAASEPVIIGATEYVFGTGFPGSDRNLYRMERAVGDPTAPFQQSLPPLWNYVPADPDISQPTTDRFMGWEMTDVAAEQDVPFVAVLSLPRWKSLYENWDDQGGPPTAWIALISIEDIDGDGTAGDFVASYQIPFSDEDEPNIPGLDFDEGAGAAWQNVYQVEINMELIDNGLEILASGGGIGYGRYLVNYPTRITEWSLF
jgi:hypothetical protein